MTDLVREAYERRAREAYVDPAPLKEAAIDAINTQLPETLTELKRHGYPSHKRLREFKIRGDKHVAWEYEYISPKVKAAQSKKGRPPAAATPTPGRSILLLIADDGQSEPVGRLLEGSDDQFDPLDVSKLNATQLWGVCGFLQSLAKEPKRNPWDE